MKIEIFFTFFFAFLAFGAFGMVFYLIAKTMGSKKWIATPAKIQLLQVKGSRRSKRPGQTRRLRLSYQYDFNGLSFNSDKVYFSNSYMQGGSTTAKIYERLKDAQFVEAFVNPENPAEAVLVRSLIGSFVSFVFLGLFCLCFVLKYFSQWYEWAPFGSLDSILAALFIAIGLSMFFIDKFGSLPRAIRVLEKHG